MTIFYNKGLYTILTGGCNFLQDDIRVLLTTASYTPNKDSNFVSDITNEISATNYSRKALVNKAVTRDDIGDVVTFDASYLLWTNLGPSSPAKVVLYKQGTADNNSILLACIDLINPVSSNNTDFVVTWNASGIFRLYN